MFFPSIFVYNNSDDSLFFQSTRVSQVTREGKYVQSSVPRQLMYGTMVYVRQAIVADASTALSRAVCIATRYSAVRRQFGSQNGGLETQVRFKTYGCMLLVREFIVIRDFANGNFLNKQINGKQKERVGPNILLELQLKYMPIHFNLIVLI